MNDPLKAKLVAQQLINNAFVAAGILDDPRQMLRDMNHVMEMALGYTPQPLIKKETAKDLLKDKIEQKFNTNNNNNNNNENTNQQNASVENSDSSSVDSGSSAPTSPKDFNQ